MATSSTVFHVGKGCVAALILFCNTITVFTAMIPFALIKLLLPFAAVRRLVDRVLNFLAQSWVAINGWWVALVGRIRWEVSGLEGLKMGSWYLVSSNHQSWVDIIVMQKIFAARIPFLKFFLKRELMYVPVMGLAWWALDFPFMRRHSKSQLQKRPELAGQDIAATRRACEKFLGKPVSIMIFPEGTRFTPAKHALQQSPYTHLLKPKSGGMAYALDAMGRGLQSVLDVTLHYPNGTPSLADLIADRVGQVTVDVRLRDIPEALRGGDYENDRAFRVRFQTWMNGLWQDKQTVLDRLTTA